MNQLCKVCGEPAAGFHFGAFTCEGCKSFFGRTYNNISAIAGCKNNGDCVINKKNRTACKACRLRKCLLVGMSKSGSRYGRRSNWFKIHCLLQEQQSHQGVTSPAGGDGGEATGGAGAGGGAGGGIGTGTNFEQLARLHQIQARQTYQDKTNPCIKSASMSPTLSLSAASLSQQAAAVAAAAAAAAQQHHHQQQQQQQQQQHQHHQHHQHRQHQPHPLLQHAQHELQRLPPHYLNAAKFLNGVASETKSESRVSAATPSDSWTSSAGDAADDSHSNRSNRSSRTACGSHQSSATPLMRHFEAEKQRDEQAAEEEQEGGSGGEGEGEEAGIDQDRGRQQQQQQQPSADFCEDLDESRRRQFLHIFRSHSEPLHTFAPTKSPFAAFAIGSLQQSPLPPGTPPMQLFLPAARKTSALRNAPDEHAMLGEETQHEPIDLSLRTRPTSSRRCGDSRAATTAADDAEDDRQPAEMRNRDVVARPAPLDLTLVRTPSLTG